MESQLKNRKVGKISKTVQMLDFLSKMTRR